MQVLDLGCGFVLDFLDADAAGEQAPEEHGEPRDKTLGGLVEQRRDLIRRQNRLAVTEDNVTADAEGWRGTSNFDGLVGGRSASHECRAGEQARLVKFEDGAVNSPGLAKVVSVNNETRHWYHADTGPPSGRSPYAGARSGQLIHITGAAGRLRGWRRRSHPWRRGEVKEFSHIRLRCVALGKSR